jgi:segregation and condensation protein B
MSLTSNVESLLFALGRRTTVEELARILRIRDNEKILEALKELQQLYGQKAGPIVVLEQDGGWKMTVADEHLPLVRRVVSKTELPKGVMETLAILAYKAPMLQSDLIKIRTNKAYDHLAMLDAHGYITREKAGRTKRIKLAKRFFDYFDIPEENLKSRFANVQALEQAIVDKETEITQATTTTEERKATVMAEEDEHKKRLQEQHRVIDQEIAQLPPVPVELVDEEGHEEKLEQYESEKRKEEPTLAPEIEIVKEPETFKIKKPRKRKKAEQAVPKAPAEEIEAIFEKPEVEAEPALPEGTSKYAPEAVEAEARKLARRLSSKEGKGVSEQSLSAEAKHKVIEEVAAMSGESVEQLEREERVKKGETEESAETTENQAAETTTESTSSETAPSSPDKE